MRLRAPGARLSANERRVALRRLSRNDPMFHVEPQGAGADGTVQVGDDISSPEPADLTYQSAQFANAIKTATLVAEAECSVPNLDVGANKLAEHRAALKALARQEPSNT